MAIAMAASSSCASSVSLPGSSSLQNPIFCSYTSHSQLNPSPRTQFPICMRITQKDLRFPYPVLLPKVQCTGEPRVTNHFYQFGGKVNGTRGTTVQRMLCQIGSNSQTLNSAVVTKDSWEKSILSSEIPVLVEFYASWCGPCRMVHRVIDEIAVEYTGRLNCFVLNTDNDLQVAEDYEIKAVPVVLLFKNGKKCDSVIGTMPKEFYVAAIEKVLNSST